jgi:hypothetical protein
MANTATGLPPLVKSRATEEQPATSAVLLSGNRPRSREPPKRVPMETQVLRRLSRVKPLVSPIGGAVLKASNYRRRHTLDETVDQQVDHRAVDIAGATEPARRRRSVSQHGSCRTGSKFGAGPTCSKLEQPSDLLALPRRVR